MPPSSVPSNTPAPAPGIKINCFTKLVVGRPVALLCAIFATACGLSYIATLTGITLGFSWADFQEPIIRREHCSMRLQAKARQLPTPFADGRDDDSVETSGNSWFDRFCATDNEQTIGVGWSRGYCSLYWFISIFLYTFFICHCYVYNS